MISCFYLSKLAVELRLRMAMDKMIDEVIKTVDSDIA